MRKLLIAFLFFSLQTVAQTETYQGKPSSAILHDLMKMQNTGKVLYLAAHPDDENTRLISFLENDLKFRTAYLSLTRGDGGQNLIGNELSEELGILRTQELLAARHLDGGEQFFTRAVDFGYSKNPEETFDFWNKQDILSDVVRIIRYFKPDVIITRFPTDGGGGHGHHTASAILAEEAMDLANDPLAFPEHLEEEGIGLHRVSHLFHNTSTWWYKDLDKQMETNDSIMRFDVGGYDPLLGKSYGEIASLARSKHRCQGFGSSLRRGEQFEYLKLVKSVKSDWSDALEPITWEQRTGDDRMDEMLSKIVQKMNLISPEMNLMPLSDLRSYMVDKKSKSLAFADGIVALDQILMDCAGIHAEVLADEWFAVANGDGELKLKLNWISRSARVKMKAYQLNNIKGSSDEWVEFNQEVEDEIVIKESDLTEITQPYWLKNGFDAVYILDKGSDIHAPDGPKALTVKLKFDLGFDQEIERIVRVMHKSVDRADGEQLRDFVVCPAFTVNFKEQALVFASNDPQTMNVVVRSFVNDAEGVLRLAVPEGWTVSPDKIDLKFAEANSSQQFSFSVKPGVVKGKEKIFAEVTVGDKAYHRSFNEISYPHIRPQVHFPLAEASAANLDLKIRGSKVGYIVGAGDKVPEALMQMGYTVTYLDQENLGSTDLSQFTAIIAGIRAYNTQDWLKDFKPQLVQYVGAGGVYLIQYNTSRGPKSEWMSPYDFTLGRSRVTDETAAVTILDPNHPVMNTPNKISMADFDGWVQERGLYFASEWDAGFKPLIAWNDPGEEPLEGGLLVGAYGKGAVIYTGISFFRELPAGVPGAFRLLANLIAYQPNIRYNGK